MKAIALLFVLLAATIADTKEIKVMAIDTGYTISRHTKHKIDNASFDFHDHGTRVINTILYGGFSKGQPISPVCPEVSVVVCGNRGRETSQLEPDTISLCVLSAIKKGVEYINISYEGDFRDEDEYKSIALATKKGIVFTVAAGNHGLKLDKQPSYPASYGLTLTSNFYVVGAYDLDYSNKVDGMIVYSGKVKTPNVYGVIVESEGTSFAAPKLLHEILLRRCMKLKETKL